jgi:hypothetical protein
VYFVVICLTTKHTKDHEVRAQSEGRGAQLRSASARIPDESDRAVDDSFEGLSGDAVDGCAERPASASADFTPMNVAYRSYFQDASRAAKLG